MQESEPEAANYVLDIRQAVRLVCGDSAYWKYLACEWAIWVPIIASLGVGLRQGSWLWCALAIVSGLAHRLANPAPSGIGVIAFAIAGFVFAGFAMANRSGWMFAAAWLPLISWCTACAIRGTGMSYLEEKITHSEDDRMKLRNAGLLVHAKDID